MKNKSYVHFFCLHMCVFHEIKEEDRGKKRINYPKNSLQSVRKL